MKHIWQHSTFQVRRHLKDADMAKFTRQRSDDASRRLPSKQLSDVETPL